MATPAKIQVVEELTSLLASAKGVYLTDFTGLTVEQMQDLRRKCRKEQIEYRVVKRTLLQRAARGSGLPALDAGLNGPCGIVVSLTDEVAPARVLSDFAKTTTSSRSASAFSKARRSAKRPSRHWRISRPRTCCKRSCSESSRLRWHSC